MNDVTAQAERLSIDIDRLWRRLEALGEIGAVHGPNGERGCARLALTDADRDGRDLVVTWMRDLGLDVTIDAIGNVVATRPGADPTAAAVMMGSHIDTVRTGGRCSTRGSAWRGRRVIDDPRVLGQRVARVEERKDFVHGSVVGEAEVHAGRAARRFGRRRADDRALGGQRLCFRNRAIPHANGLTTGEEGFDEGGSQKPGAEKRNAHAHSCRSRNSCASPARLTSRIS